MLVWGLYWHVFAIRGYYSKPGCDKKLGVDVWIPTLEGLYKIGVPSLDTNKEDTPFRCGKQKAQVAPICLDEASFTGTANIVMAAPVLAVR